MWRRPWRTIPIGDITQLVALVKPDRSVTLVDELEEELHARFLEHLLEKRLRIADRPVEGELLR